MRYAPFHSHGDSTDDQRPAAGSPVLLRITALAVVWWVLTGGDAQAWAWGIPAVLIAALLQAGLPAAGPWRWHLGGFTRFVPVFVWCSVRGALDVARIALDPRRLPNPTIFEYRLQLPPGPACIFFANLVNLVPGTVVTRVTPRRLQIHVLDATSQVIDTLVALELRVADLFGLDRPPPAPPKDSGHD